MSRLLPLLCLAAACAAPTPSKTTRPIDRPDKPAFEALRTRDVLNSAIHDGQGRHSATHTGYRQSGRLYIGAANAVRLDLVLERYHRVVRCPDDRSHWPERQACVDGDPPPTPEPERLSLTGEISGATDGAILDLRYSENDVERRTVVQCRRSELGLEGVELDCEVDQNWPRLPFTGDATLRFGPVAELI